MKRIEVPKLPPINPVAAASAVGVGLLALIAWKVYRTLFPEAQASPTTNVQPQQITVPATLTADQAQAIALQVFAAIYGSGSIWNGSFGEDEAAVIAALSQAQNDADVALIAQAYGVRSGSNSLHGDLNLWGTLQTFLSASDRADLNDIWASKGIHFRA